MLYEIYNAGRFISRGKGEHPTRTIESDELIFVIQGELDMFESDRQFHVHAGEWLILHRRRRHGGSSRYPKNLSFFWLHFYDQDGWLEQLPQHGKAESVSRLSGYFQNFLTEQSRISPEKKILDLLFQLIVAELQRDAVPERKSTPLAAAAKSFIDLHYMEPVNLASTAEILHCNPEYLGRLYHQCFGETFAAALNRRRLERAAAYLRESSCSVKEIMTNCGFCDPAYFRRSFRNFYHQSPAEYRKNLSEEHRNSL